MFKNLIKAPRVIKYDDREGERTGYNKNLGMFQEEILPRVLPTFRWLRGIIDIHNTTGVFDNAEDDPYRNGVDYHATWEDAFLFQGYENGEKSFLTALVCQNIDAHGFITTTTSHWPEKKNPKLGKNEVIVRLQFKGQECIPSLDIQGKPVIIGKTNPRLYLPREVQKLLDSVFGYDLD